MRGATVNTEETLKQWRERLGYTQPQMALYVNLPYTSWVNYERGRCTKLPTTAVEYFKLMRMLEVFNPAVLEVNRNRVIGVNL